jgi:uncharacterized protein YjbI with pentapeptide repeats
MKKEKPIETCLIVGIIFASGGVIAKNFIEIRGIGDIFFVAGIILVEVAVLLFLSKGESLINWLIQYPIRFFLPIFVGGLIILLFLNHFYHVKFEDILPELNGTLIELLILGVLWSLYDELKTKRERIRSIDVGIDSCRDDQGEESGRKLKQLILESKNLGWTKLNLNNCKLNNLTFQDINLEGSTLIGTYLSDTRIYNSNFNNCKIGGGEYNCLEVDKSSFNSAYFNNFDGRVCFENCDLTSAVFESCNFSCGDKVCFKDCDLTSAEFKSCDLKNLSLSSTKIGDYNKWSKMLKNSRNENLEEFLRNHYIDESKQIVNRK